MPSSSIDLAMPAAGSSLAPATGGRPGARLPAAVLWDMDGTLIDTDQYWMAAERDLVASFGGTWTEADGLALIGTPLLEGARVLRAHGVDMSADEIVEHLVARVRAHVVDAAPWQPGALEVLTWLREQGVPCALVTMSYRALADALVEQAPEGTFTAVVTGDEVTHGKPHPEPYLTAAALLGVPIEECLVVEDSPSGIGAALACGAVAVGVEVMVPVAPAPRLSRIRSLTALTPELVERLVRGEIIDQVAPAA